MFGFCHISGFVKDQRVFIFFRGFETECYDSDVIVKNPRNELCFNSILCESNAIENINLQQTIAQNAL